MILTNKSISFHSNSTKKPKSGLNVQMIIVGFTSFDDLSFIMMTNLSITLVFIVTVFAFSGIAINEYFAMGQTNTKGAEVSDGNTAKMHVD